VQGTFGVVLKSLRRPERSHHGVAGELLDSSSRLLDLRAHRVVKAFQPGPSALGILLARGRG
jgi:hypothetical protein